jgi:hypothetical protein
MTWIYQITLEMKKAEKLCNERGIYMELVIRNEPWERVYLRYLDSEVDKVSPKPYVSKKDAEMVMYNHYVKICDKLKIPL